MRIGVVGGGVVGRATARCYMEHSEVKVYDIVKERSTHTLEETLGSDLVFVCLPTPIGNKEGADVSALIDFFSFAASYHASVNYVLRSTVPIGTTKKLADSFNLSNLVHSPEFLTARCAVTDAQLPARNIIGDPGIPYPADEFGDKFPESRKLLHRLYDKRFPGVPVLVMSSSESEAVKLFQNSFFAVKVAFFNEINELSERLKLDWDRVLAGMLSDGRIAHAHTKVPGPDGKYGFWGECLF